MSAKNACDPYDLYRDQALSLVSIKAVRIASTWLQTRFLNFSRITWSLHSSNDRRYSYFTRNICNRCTDSFKIFFGVKLETCPAIVMTMRRSGFKAWFPLTLSGRGGRNPPPPPLRFFLHNSKMPGEIEKKLSDFNFTPLMDILRILSITSVVRCCHSNLLFPVCHVIFLGWKNKETWIIFKIMTWLSSNLAHGAIFRSWIQIHKKFECMTYVFLGYIF